MNNRKALLLPALALAIGTMHLAALRLPDCFGFDALRYFSGTATGIWALLFLALAAAIVLIPLERLLPKLNSKYFLAMIALFWLLMLYLLRTSAPLLGDGLARVQGIRAAYLSELKSQPALLDAVIHFLLFQILKGLPRSDFLTYALLSYLAGLFYLVMVFSAGRKIFPASPQKILWLLIMLAPGYVELFAGYAENYSFLPGLVLLWVLGVIAAERGKIRLLILSQILLILFHLFFLLLLPATLYLLLVRPEKKFRLLALALSAAGAGVLAIALVLVWKYFRGPAIFLSPARIFTLGHLLDFFNHQILASPAFPILLLGLWPARTGRKFSSAEKALGAGALVLVGFFFFLRPVIGAARDWDLFSFPAMLYTPALVWYLLQRLKDRPGLMARFGAFIFLVSAFHTGAWLSVNHFEPEMISRIQFHLDENRGRERWASAYGYVVLGKYYVLTDRIPEALSAFDQSIKINPSYSQNRLAYGYQLWRAGRYEEAIAQMERARAINPTNPGIRKFLAHFYREYARILMDSGRTGEAEAYLKKLFELDPAK